LTSQFVATGTTITNSAGTTFDVYAEIVPPGAVTLGGNLDSGMTTGSMYSVLVDPLCIRHVEERNIGGPVIEERGHNFREVNRLDSNLPQAFLADRLGCQSIMIIAAFTSS
jgi:hypothetical protein